MRHRPALELDADSRAFIRASLSLTATSPKISFIKLSLNPGPGLFSSSSSAGAAAPPDGIAFPANLATPLTNACSLALRISALANSTSTPLPLVVFAKFGWYCAVAKTCRKNRFLVRALDIHFALFPIDHRSFTFSSPMTSTATLSTSCTVFSSSIPPSALKSASNNLSADRRFVSCDALLRSNAFFAYIIPNVLTKLFSRPLFPNTTSITPSNGNSMSFKPFVRLFTCVNNSTVFVFVLACVEDSCARTIGKSFESVFSSFESSSKESLVNAMSSCAHSRCCSSSSSSSVVVVVVPPPPLIFSVASSRFEDETMPRDAKQRQRRGHAREEEEKRV